MQCYLFQKDLAAQEVTECAPQEYAWCPDGDRGPTSDRACGPTLDACRSARATHLGSGAADCVVK